MNILLIGEIVGKLGRQTVGRVLPNLRRSANISVVFANAENIAHGKGATEATLEAVRDYGVDYFTSGNHIFWRKEVLEELDADDPSIIRPANYPEDVPGRGFKIINLGKDGKVLLINLLGRTFFDEPVFCPFRTVDEILENFSGEELAAVVVDFHAEATSEQVAMGWYLDGRASVVAGTHRHVPTADAWVMPQGTAYVTDIGMVGSRHSVLGVEKEIIIQKLKNPQPQKFEWVEEGPAVFNAVLIEVENGKAKSIERVDKVLSA
jgi:metallophosphoesterase (TIGR00282 family)